MTAEKEHCWHEQLVIKSTVECSPKIVCAECFVEWSLDIIWRVLHETIHTPVYVWFHAVQYICVCVCVFVVELVCDGSQPCTLLDQFPHSYSLMYAVVEEAREPGGQAEHGGRLGVLPAPHAPGCHQ